MGQCGEDGGPGPPLSPSPVPCRLPSSHALDLKQLHISVIPDGRVHIPAGGACWEASQKRPWGRRQCQSPDPPSLRSHLGVPPSTRQDPPWLSILARTHYDGGTQC